MPRPVAAALALVAVAASGCASTPLKTYPEFPDRYSQSARTHLVADVAILDDVRGRRDQLTLGANRDLADRLTDSLAVWMGARGYAVDHAYPGAVGLLLSPAVVVRLRDAEGDPDDAVRDSVAAPFWVDAAVQSDSVLMSALWMPEGEGPRAANPEAYVSLVVRGRRVPLGKTLLQGVLTGVASGLLTGGAASVSVYQTSGSAVELRVVDGATGEVLWSDLRQVQYDASEKAVFKMARALADRLPARP